MNRIKFFNAFYQKESFEIFKQIKFEDEQLITYSLFQFQFHIITKSELASSTSFQKSHFKKFWIILINTSNPTKGIVFNKGGNTVYGPPYMDK